MFIEVAAIEKGKAMGVFREMAWYPVKDYTNAFPMAAIYESLKFIKLAKAAGGGIKTGYLVTPGAIKRMLGNRH